MRPLGSVGEIRQAIRIALREHGPMAQADIPAHACISRSASLNTVKNMVRSGELAPVGKASRPHCKRPVVIYDFADPAEKQDRGEHDGGLLVLSSAMSAWR